MCHRKLIAYNEQYTKLNVGPETLRYGFKNEKIRESKRFGDYILKYFLKNGRRLITHNEQSTEPILTSVSTIEAGFFCASVYKFSSKSVR